MRLAGPAPSWRAQKGVSMPSIRTHIETPVLVEYDYQPAEAPVMDADSPLFGPGCDEDVWVTAVYVDVLDVLPSLSREQIDGLTQACLDAEHKKREARDADR